MGHCASGEDVVSLVYNLLRVDLLSISGSNLPLAPQPVIKLARRRPYLAIDIISHLTSTFLKSLLPKSVLSALFAVMAKGVVPLEVVVALFAPVGGRPSSFCARAH